MHRFLVTPASLTSGKVTLNPKESHHAQNVLRVRLGEAVEVLDGQGTKFTAVVAGFERGRVVLSLGARVRAEKTGPQVVLAPAVIRPERMEWMLEKACELGVSGWQPVLAERSVVKLPRERWQAKTARWQKLAAASCKQCGLARVPDIGAPMAFKELAARIPEYEAAFIPTLAAEAVMGLREGLARHHGAKKILWLIGPEGDFTPQELRMAVEAGAQPVTFGSRVLRAETAALYALSVTQFSTLS